MSDPRANPYAPPATPAGNGSPRGTGGALRSTWIWCYVADQLVATASDGAYVTLGIGASGYGVFLRLVAVLIGLAWLGSSYERVPERLRSECTPGAFIGRHFIPIFNFYWVFKAQNLLCDGIDALLVERGLRPDAPRGLAMIGCGCALASRIVASLPGGWFVAFSLLQAGVWTAYMIGIEGAFARASSSREGA